MLLVSVFSLNAQDTIDTNYYRYDYHFPNYVFMGPTPTINGVVNACPNGIGFHEYNYWRFDDSIYPGLYELVNNIPYDTYSGTGCYRGSDYIHSMGESGPIYMYYQLGEGRQTIYGIAFTFDAFFNLTEGDSVTAVLSTCSADRTRFIDLDSITIKGGEMGKRRWMEIPLLRSDAYTTSFPENGPYDNCIDTVRYCQVLEFYFDERSYTIEDDFLLWKLRISDANGSVFAVPYIDHLLGKVPWVSLEDGEIICQVTTSCWNFLFPILSPLPDWEVPTITQVVPDAQKPDNPDPQDPQDPEDPEDPENPGGDEGIGEAVGSQQSAVSIYPNPASGYAVVTCDAEIRELTLCDVNGRLLLSMRNCGGSAKVDTSVLAPGVYMLRVTTDAGTATRKLAVK